MASPRKRTLSEVDGRSAEPAGEQSTLHRLRNMWQFANLCQWICVFGKAMKIDAVKIESNSAIDVFEFEAECLRPSSMMLQEIGLSILKFLSSHRGLNHSLFDEYTRRQYLAKDPDRNPFGVDEEPAKFADFDVFKKIRVLHQMTQFVMRHPERLRERTEEQKDSEQANWRIEPFGWDCKDRTYYVLDDNRLYRLTEAPPSRPKPKKNSKKYRAAQRANKRRRVSAAAGEGGDDGQDDAAENSDREQEHPNEDDGLGGMKWECIAVTLDEVEAFLATIRKTKDVNEKILRNSIEDYVVPVLKEEEEIRREKIRRKEKELLNLEKMAHAKRSSRLANKAEQHKLEEQARDEERQRQAEAAAARKDEQKRLKLERERDLRLMAREKRLKERESRRLQHQEELAQLSEDSARIGSEAARLSERRLQAEIEKRKEALRELEEEDDWIFDCICGAYGQVDDGTHSVSCEKCNVWQHSKCLGIKEEDAEQEDFHFICSSCRRREKEAKERPRQNIIKIKVPGASSSPPAPRHSSPHPQEPVPSTNVYVEIPATSSVQTPQERATPNMNGTAATIGSSPSGHNQLTSVFEPPREHIDSRIPIKGGFGTSQTTSHGIASSSDGSSSKTVLNGLSSNPFSSPHPELSPPDQSPNKSRAYGTIHNQSGPVTGASHIASAEHASLAMAQTNGSGSLLPVIGNGSSLSSKLSSPSKSVIASASIIASSPARSLATEPLLSTKSPLTTPRLDPSRRHGDYQFDASSPLIPSTGGNSPTKHPPPAPQPAANGLKHSISPASTVLPPVAALTPSPRQEILTPPVKPVEPPRPGLHGQL